MCDSNCDENVYHLFFDCVLARRVWFKIQIWLGINFIWSGELYDEIQIFSDSLPSKFRDRLLAVWHAYLWCIWYARNELIFKGIRQEAREIFEAIKWLVWSWFRSQSVIRKTANLADWDCFPDQCVSA